MADVTNEEHERIMIEFRQSSDRFRSIALSSDELCRGFAALAEAAKKVEFPPVHKIAMMRMERMKNEYGIIRFLMPSWWRWLWIMLPINLSKIAQKPSKNVT